MKEIPHQITFAELTNTNPDAMSVASFGPQGSGKSRFGATYPSPIGVVALDRKTRYTIAKDALAFGKKVIMPQENGQPMEFIRVGNPMQLAMLPDDCGKSFKPKFSSAMPECCSMHFYRWHTNRIKEAVFRLVDLPKSKCKSIILDTGSQYSEDVLYACYGRTQKIMPRDRGMYNQDMIDFLNALDSKHLLITHKAKTIWKNEQPTDKMQRKGFNEIGYHVNVEIEHYRAKKKDKHGNLPFYIDIGQCQANSALVGEEKALDDEGITFQNLAMLVFEGSDLEDWE